MRFQNAVQNTFYSSKGILSRRYGRRSVLLMSQQAFVFATINLSWLPNEMKYLEIWKIIVLSALFLLHFEFQLKHSSQAIGYTVH